MLLLLFFLSPLPTAFGFTFLFNFLFFWFVWCCSHELIGQIPELFHFNFSFNAETVVTDVALVMGFVLFCFVLQILELLCKEENIGCFPYFLKVTAVVLSIIGLWHRAKKWFNSVFVSLIFIYWSFVCFFFVCLFFLGGRVDFMCVTFLVEGKQDSR